MYYLEYAPKNIIETKIYKDFFSKEDLDRIMGSIEYSKGLDPKSSFHAPVIQESLSRLHIEVIYPEDILKRLEMFASELCGEKVILSHNSYYHYSKKYNPDMQTPILKPHRDFDNYYSKLTLDYQLDKNVDWSIVIEGKRYNLEFGDMLAFWGAGLVHWRENIVLGENEETSVLTFHFSNEDDDKRLNISSRSQEERDKRRAENKKDPVWIDFTRQWEEEREKFSNRKNEV